MQKYRYKCAESALFLCLVSSLVVHKISRARLETTPLLSGERDWQAAVLRVVPVREESHAAIEPRAKGVVPV